MQPEGYGAAIYIFELQAHIASSSPRYLLLRCCEVLLFCRLVSVFTAPSGGYFLVSTGSSSKCEAKCGKENQNGKTKEKHWQTKRQKDKGKTTSAPAPPTSPRDLLLAPHPSSPSLSARCSNHPRVATPLVWMKSCNIVAPFGVKRRECSVVFLVFPTCRLSSWYSLQPRRRCLTLWTLSEHWHCVES